MQCKGIKLWFMHLLKGSFQDSVSLMLISRKLSESPGVDEISVMMGTPANKSLLEVTGFGTHNLERQRLTIFVLLLRLILRIQRSPPKLVNYWRRR